VASSLAAQIKEAIRHSALLEDLLPISCAQPKLASAHRHRKARDLQVLVSHRHREATAQLAEVHPLLEVILIAQVSKEIDALPMDGMLIRLVSMNVFVLRKFESLMAAPISNTAFL